MRPLPFPLAFPLPCPPPAGERAGAPRAAVGALPPSLRATACALSFLLLSGCNELPAGHRYDGPLFEPAALPACTPLTGETHRWCGEGLTGPLQNPGQGITTFHDFNDDHERTTHPAAGVAYFRHYWSEIEPQEGEIDFDLLDTMLARAAANGQTVGWRLMAEATDPGSMKVPAWLADAAGGAWGQRDGVEYFSPNYDSVAFLDAVERTLTAIGARYDGDPRLDHVDIGVVGNTGEWSYTNDAEQMPTEANSQRIIEAHRAAFPSTRLIMLAGDVDDGGAPLSYATERGAGWRVDCWGDISGDNWNHHDNFYEQRFEEAALEEVWTRAPVALETCGEMEQWALLGYDDAQVRWLLHWALQRHASVLNNKSRSVPEAWRSMVDEALVYTGARLVLREVVVDKASGTVGVTVVNQGNAALYRGDTLVVELVDDDGAHTIALSGEASSTGYLGPGTHPLSGDLPAALSGTFSARARLQPPAGAEPFKLANEGVDEDGWVVLGDL